MTSPAYPVFEGDGGTNTPQRPVAETHLGGLQFQDSPTHPPTDKRRMSATDFMQTTRTVERCARMVPALIAEVDGATGLGNTVLGVVCTNDAITTSNVTVTHSGTGQYIVAWPSGSLPPKRINPVAIAQYVAAFCGSRAQTGASIALSFVDSAYAPIDTKFVLYIDGE